MYFEGNSYHFTHRSFQEYFCALFFSKQKDKFIARLGEFFEKHQRRMFGDRTFYMLYDMVTQKVEEYMLLPFLTSLFDNCNKADGYWTFLEAMYPQRETLTSAGFRNAIVAQGTPDVSSLWHQQQKNPPFVLLHDLYKN